MLSFFRTIFTLRRLRRVKPDTKWLESRRAYFTRLTSRQSAPSALPAFFGARLARVLIAAALVVALGGGGVVNSAQAALPDEALYPIKLLAEEFQKFFIFGDENKVNFALERAERRLEEASAVGTDDEELLVGTIVRAGGNLEEGKQILVSAGTSSSNSASLKNFEKAFEKLEKLAEQKEKLAEKLAEHPIAKAALAGVSSVSVDVEEAANRIIITFSTSTQATSTAAIEQFLEERASTTIARAEAKIREVELKVATSTNGAAEKLAEAKEKLADAKQEFSERDFKNAIEKATDAYKKAVEAELKLFENSVGEDVEKSVRQVIKLLIEGAGKSGKIPPGLLKAPGIEKKLDKHDDDDDGDDRDEKKDKKGKDRDDDDDDEEDEDKDDEDEDNDDDDDDDRDRTAPVISNIRSGEISTSSARVSWATNEPADSRIEYGTSTSYGQAASRDSRVREHNILLSGLSASTTYHFRVLSKDKAGNLATSTDRTFMTSAPPPPADTTPPAISSTSVSGVTTSTAAISWITNEAGDSRVNYGTSTSYGATAFSASFVTNHGISLHGLAASTTYHFQIVSKDDKGNAATSSDATFTTASEPPADTAPPVISSVGATGISSSSATVGWSTNEPSTGTVYYSTSASVDPASTSTLSQADNVLAVAHSLGLPGLNATTTYHFFIEAKDASGNAATSTISSFITAE